MSYSERDFCFLSQEFLRVASVSLNTQRQSSSVRLSFVRWLLEGWRRYLKVFILFAGVEGHGGCFCILLERTHVLFYCRTCLAFKVVHGEVAEGNELVAGSNGLSEWTKESSPNCWSWMR